MIAQGGAHAERSSQVRNPGSTVKEHPVTPKARPEMGAGLMNQPRQLRIHVDRRATPAGFGELRSGVDPGFRE